MIKLTGEQLDRIAERAQIAFCLDKYQSFEIAFADMVQEEVLRLNGVGGEAATIAGLESATGHLSALVDDLRGLMARAMASMKALHDASQPVDEPRGDFDARVPYDAFRRFVDEHAALLYDLNHGPHELPAAAPQPQQAEPGALLEGWQLVPVEPTPEMLEAVAPFPEHLRDDYPDPADYWHKNMEAATKADQMCAASQYRSMLSAAPKPSPVQDGWLPIETAPMDGDLVAVFWLNSDGEEMHDLDHTEDGCWVKWHDYAEHVEIIGGNGVSYTPPYTHWKHLGAPKPKDQP
jgi:hypothetical protein